MNLKFLHDSLERLSDRDRRALKIAAVAVVVLLAYAFLLAPWLDHWSSVKTRLEAGKARLAQLDAIKPQASVPVLEMPQKLHQQRLLFERKLREQLKKAGIAVKTLKYRGKGKRNAALNGNVLQLECTAPAKFEQVLTLLSGMNENPYLISIEQLDIQVGPEKKRQEMTLNLTATTLAL